MYQLWRISLDKIYIPTLGRHDNQITYNALPDKWKKLVIMVVQKKEEHLYEYDCEYLVVDNDIGIAKTRDIIHRHGGISKYFIVDDDLKFVRRNVKYYGDVSNMEMSKRDFIDNDYDEMIESIDEKLDGNVVLVGPRLAFLPPAQERYWDTGGGQYNAYALNGEVFSKLYEEIDWSWVDDTTIVCEDILLNLEILSRGYKIGKFDEFLYNTKFGSDGGCSTFRTDDSILTGMNIVKEKFKDYVTVLSEEHKQGQPKVRIQWKKLYMDSQVSNIKEFYM